MKPDSKKILHRYLSCIVPLALFGFFLIGLASYLSVAKKEYWEVVRDRLASRQQNIPAVRGNIYSADGQLLVGSMPTYTLYVDFVIIDSNDTTAQRKSRERRDTLFVQKRDSICEGLHEIRPQKSTKEFAEVLRTALRNAYSIEAGHGKFMKNGKEHKLQRTFVLARNVSYIDYMKFTKLPYVKLGRNRSGFYGIPTPKRPKPYGNLASRFLGSYKTAADSAVNGLEFAFDSLLRGTPGKKHMEKVRQELTSHTDVEPVNGYDLITTLDVGMQDAAERILKRKLIELDAEFGVVVLMEVATGDVKAMVNLERTAAGLYREGPNYALTALWEPGSTFKTASLMVALEDGMIKRGDIVDTGNGQFPMHGRTMKDHNWHRNGYGPITVDECLMYSSNVGVSRIIDEHYRNEPGKFVDGLRREGVGVAFDMQIPGAQKPYVRHPNDENSRWSKTTLPWMSIGYETQIPPIYTVTFYNAIANGGRMVKPRFVKELRKDGTTVKEFPIETVKERICSPATLRDIHEILERVVNDPKGLGKMAGNRSFKVCGKTGTAQVADQHGGYHSKPSRYMVSFAGFYPSEEPKYSCVVCIKKSGLPASGGGMAGPVFGELAQYVMAKGVYRPAAAGADSTSVFERPLPPEQPDTTAGVVPDVSGLGARDAVGLLEAQGLKVRIKGHGHVKHQDIAPGSKSTEGKTIELTMDL